MSVHKNVKAVTREISKVIRGRQIMQKVGNHSLMYNVTKNGRI